MPCLITNPSVEPTTLPFPFRGVLRGRQTIALSIPASAAIANLGGVTASAALIITDAPAAVGPWDDAAYGGGAIGTGTLLIPGNLVVEGTITANNEFKAVVTGFTAALLASQTNRVIGLIGTTAVGWVAPFPGRLDSISAQISPALLGAGQSVTLALAINGVVAVGDPQIVFTANGGETTLYDTAAVPGTAFVAGDIITVVYTSTATTNTPNTVASIGVTY